MSLVVTVMGEMLATCRESSCAVPQTWKQREMGRFRGSRGLDLILDAFLHLHVSKAKVQEG